ncbi:RING-H2 finger protein ATL74 [Oryza brachyantha]|uniref:RING-H2 finger protein ATL74 n=1 Tax=Oryza brachyantha TaxID=4533 RepID=UPI001ADD4692|nr:RING-H2 finger protein ATL74 [Oryza brachyantha]
MAGGAPPASVFDAARPALESGGGGGGAPPPPGAADASFDTNMVIILAALFFALLFAIGLNSLARCALRCGGRGPPGGGGGGEAAVGVACGGSGGGIKRRALRSIPVEVYSGGEETAGDVCAICLGEFADGEKVRVLPRCGHGFHVRCVDAWLVSRGSCPTCRRQVIDGGGGGGRAVSRIATPPDSDTIAVVVA